MNRRKTHLITVKKFDNNKQEIIMRDVREAMEFLATLIHRRSSEQMRQRLPLPPPDSDESHTPATHIYCYDAKVVPFPQQSN